jgi:dTDP-glucose 4,6-dehydratase
MPKRVLLTGASGFFGHHMLRHILMNTDWEVVCICSWTHKGMPERVKQAIGGSEEFAKRVDVITHDLEAPLTERTKNNIGKIDYILNIASNSHVDRSITDPAPFVMGNVALVTNMLEYAREAKPELFLQFSTDEVYGPAPEGVDFEEWSTILPSNPYSASKAAQEAIAVSYWRTFDVPVVLTNTMNLTGQAQDPEKFPALCLRRIFKGEKIMIHGKPNDIGSRYYIHARNAADAVLYIINNLGVKHYVEDVVMRPDRYNIVGETELNNLELAQMIAKLMGKELIYEFMDFHASRPGHDRRYALSGKKLKELGWEPPTDFETSLKSTIDWTLKNKEWL